jgi:hypothetical protein
VFPNQELEALAVDQHGTPARYRGNRTRPPCRCRECVQANSAYQAEYRVRSEAPDYEPVKPGTADGVPYPTTARHLTVGKHAELVSWVNGRDGWKGETVAGIFAGSSSAGYRLRMADGTVQVFPRRVWEVCEL